LWTAYYLLRHAPQLRVVVLEREIAGFGASGRNGGWCSSLFPTRCGPDMRKALGDTVLNVGHWCADEDVDAHFVHGGALQLARTPAQVNRLRGEHGAQWLDAAETTARLNATGVLGAAFDPDCATVHPGRLVRGLARAVEQRGGVIHEQTPVQRIAPHEVTTGTGRIRAGIVVRATEGWTPELAGLHRAVVPVYSLVVATEPVPAPVWDTIGWSKREAVTDGRHLIIYAQRTADDRIVFGGRGAPYHFGSRVLPTYDHDEQVFAALRAALVELFPSLADVCITHRWGGPLGVPRDFHPSVHFDQTTGMAHAGGYVGDGVAASNLAGHTLADLILRRDTERTHLSWVGHRSRRWEHEPLRWLGVNAGRVLASSIDHTESRGRRARVRSAVLNRLTGH
jgi:glycine/D-amino acid oxidase-like deaminating enzyme